MTTPRNGLFTLTDKVAVVTGGASGIGAGIAAVLAEAGATVVIADRDREAAEREATALTDAGLKAAATAVDVADENSVVTGCADIVANVGVPWLLVNNAAVQDRELLLDTTAQEWDRINTVNARGAFLMTRELARAMARPRPGRIQFLISWPFIELGHAAVGLRPRAPVMPWTAPCVGRFHRCRWSLSSSRRVFSRERGPEPSGSGRERLDATVLDAFTSA